jgi:porin
MQNPKMSPKTTGIQVSEKLRNYAIASGLGLLSLLLLATHRANAETSFGLSNTSDFTIQPLLEESTSDMSQVTNVNQLSDVQPTDWAFQALQSLVERYGCIAGYPKGTFRGNRAMTRYEFAAGLNACLNRVNELIATATTDLVKKEDLATLRHLQESFAGELTTLRGRVDTLEAHTAELTANQFSTTTKLRGQIIMAVNAGGFSGSRIIVPGPPPGTPPGNSPGTPNLGGNPIANQPNATVLYRAGIDLDTSFHGTDLLKIRLDTGSGPASDETQRNRGLDNSAGLLEPNFGSVIDYSVRPPTNNDISLSRLYYSFQLAKDFRVSVGPNIFSTDYADSNSYANLSFLDFSTLAFVNNFILFPINGPSAGAAIDWKPGKSAFSVRALYVAPDAGNPGKQGPGVLSGLSSFTQVLYPDGFANAAAPNGNPNVTGERGLFGSTYQGTVEVEYAPTRAFALRLQYSGGEVFSNRFDVFGVNAELTLGQKFGIFGRYGYGNYNDTAFGDIKPNYWMAGVAMRDLFTRGALAGIAVGQPFVANQIGNSTQTNFEAFYNYPFSRNIQVTPTIQVINHAGNLESNDTIVTGTVRTVFSF